MLHEADQPDLVVDLPDAHSWPANTVLRLIFRLPKQMLPQRLIRESLVQAFRQSLVESELSLPDISPTNQVPESLIQQACAEQLP